MFQVSNRLPIRSLPSATQVRAPAPNPALNTFSRPLTPISLASLTPLLQQASDAIINAHSNSVAMATSNSATLSYNSLTSPSGKTGHTGSVSLLPPKNLKEILPKGSEQHMASERARVDRERHGGIPKAPATERTTNGSIPFISHLLKTEGDRNADLRRDINSNSAGSMPLYLTPNPGAPAMTVNSMGAAEQPPNVESMLRWRDGVGHLPGTNMKVSD